MDVLPICPICYFEDESVIHTPLGCSQLGDIWKKTNIPFVEEFDCEIPFVEWLESAIAQWNANHFASFAIICYLLWNRRNDVNSNASLHSDGRAGLGCVVRSWDGRVLAAMALNTSASAFVTQIKVEAVLKGVELARDLGIFKVQIEGYCEWVWSSLSKGFDPLSPIGTVVANIRSVLSSFTEFQFHWIPRVANKVAHELAQHGCTFNSCQVWPEDNPSVIVPCS
ncbi:putative ribonuclease H-like domain-containing protein [Senna tora]|uniref:Putative ribonuclease H-like domain-containing protein n=1 Tax=Senna tora TaxID=362788 RepID=A0A834TMP8_9FABA|nr:putative ribonuclease H-like domain-containing protein [Senna tora]